MNNLSAPNTDTRDDKIKVVRWAKYEIIRNELPECDDDPIYEDAIKEAVISDGIRINGDQHQNAPNGIPVFSDGTYALYSMRA